MSKRLNINSAPALAGIVGPIVMIVGDLAASLSTPNYSLVRDPVSYLGLTSIGWLQSICFLAMGLLEVIFVAGLFFNIRRARGFRPGIGLLAFGGFGLMLIAAFRMDAYGGPRTVAGTIHNVAALGIFSLFPIAILLLAPSLRSTPGWKNIFVYTLIAGVLALALVAGLFLFGQTGWFGLYERIIVGNALIWMEVVAIHFLHLLLRQEPKPQSRQINNGQAL
jgi:hypothetical membrane protein